MSTAENTSENPADNTARTFEQYRVLLFSIAYRMLGSATDAEDIVQEAFLRWLQMRDDAVQSPKAYLTTVVVRLCIDHARSARAQREVYVGPWLPEPLLTSQRPEQTDTAILAESLSFAFLVMLESLAPLERAVFLLRDVFDYDYAEIAAIVGKSEANCRQVLHRARARLGERRPRFDVSPAQQERMTTLFLRASTDGDMGGLLSLLAEDVVYTSDGGGKVRAALRSVHGRDNVARGTMGGLRFLPAGIQGRIEEVNGQPAIVGYVDQQIVGIVLLDLRDGQIEHVYFVLNPDKLP